MPKRHGAAVLRRREDTRPWTVEQFIGQSRFELADSRLKCGDLILELEDPFDPFQADTLTAQP